MCVPKTHFLAIFRRKNPSLGELLSGESGDCEWRSNQRDTGENPSDHNPSQTHREQLDDLLIRLEQQKDTLLNADVWDDQAIDLNAQLRYVFTHVIGKDERSLANYLGDYGMVWFEAAEIEQGLPFKADEWTWSTVDEGFFHDYFDNISDDHERFLPDGFAKVPYWEFPDRATGPATGNAIIQIFDGYLTNFDPDDLMNADVLGDGRYECGQVMVKTGYLTNQANLTGDDAEVLAAYKAFSPALRKPMQKTKAAPDRAKYPDNTDHHCY